MLTHWLFGVSLPLMLAGQGAGTDWVRLNPKGQGFSVLLPGTASEHEGKLTTKAGAVDVAYFLVEYKDLTYVVSVSKFPKGTLKADTQNKRLENARDGALESAGGELVSEKAVKLGTVPGRELLIDGKKAFVRTRIYAAENRLYQTMAVGSKDKVHGANAKRFFDSFKIAK